MNMLANYFLLEGKRSLIFLKKSILSMTCVVLSFAAIVLVVCHFMLQTTLFPKIEVGVVMNEEDEIMELAANYISDMESVDSVCNFHYVDYEEGEEMLAEGELEVVIVLPDTLYDDLNSLENASATILLPENESMGVRMFSQILSSGIGLLHVGEAGVKASYTVSSGENMLITRSELGNFLAARYASHALDRMDTFEELVISPTGIMSIVQFYFLCMLLCLCMVCGLNFSYLYETKQKAMQNKLCIEGVGKVQQSFVKILIMSIYLFGLQLGLYGLGIFVSNIAELYFVEFSIGAVPIMLLLSVAISVHFHMIYVLARDERQGALLLLVTSILMIVCAGLLVPQAYLPEIAQYIGVFTPLYSWSMIGQQMLFGELSLFAMWLMSAWIVAEILIGVYVSWKNA